ncbi:MAG: aquaporin family protein [Bacteroidales bacterium]|nr:aquaporin family protein [Bacteroidales bacterium]
MSEFVAEIIGTMLLVLLGDGVVANVVLNKTKGNGGGWLLINWGWGLGVFIAVATVGPVSGAHINPSVTVGLALGGVFPWAKVGTYITAQMIGAALGAFLVWLSYHDHFKATDDSVAKLGVFSTVPEIRNKKKNFLTEVIGTFVLVYAVFLFAGPSLESPDLRDVEIGLGSIGALPVGLLVGVIGMSLGGPTGYAINPARDLGPRIMHAILPIKDKKGSDWGYSWVPIFGPLAGAGVAAAVYLIFGG